LATSLSTGKLPGNVCIIIIIIIIIIISEKINVALSQKKLQGHVTHRKRRRVG